MRISDVIARLAGLAKGNRLAVLGIKYIPVIGTLLLTVHVGLLLLGFYEPVTVALAVFLLVVLLILLSVRFNFCWLHKTMIIYLALMTVCICIQKYDGFGLAVTAIRLVLFSIGAGLLALALFKNRIDHGDCE